MRHLMPLLMDVLKCHISYQFKSKFEKLNKYSFANNFFMGIGIAVPPIHRVYMVKQTPRHIHIFFIAQTLKVVMKAHIAIANNKCCFSNLCKYKL